MMGEHNRKKVALGAALGMFFLLLVSFFLLFYSEHGKDFFTALVSIKTFGVPFIFYAFSISFLGSLLLFFGILFFKAQGVRQIEEKIHLLSKGVYDKRYFKESQLTDPTLKELSHDLEKIALTMQDLSNQVQIQSAVPKKYSGQTKEEILTEERHRLARELHDSVSQQLFAAMMMLSALTELGKRQNLPEKFQQQLKTVEGIINASQSEMRALLLHLRPIDLEGKSLKTGIIQLMKELQTKVQIQLTWEIEEVTLPSQIEDHLFRIVQEVLSNTLRHAKAKSLEVYLHEINGNVLLRIVDDGVGFDTSIEKSGSYGLQNIKERTLSLGGRAKIISLKNQGTSVEIQIPIAKEEIL